MYKDSALSRFRLWYWMQPVAMRIILAINIGAFLAWWFILSYIDALTPYLTQIFMVQQPLSFLTPVQLFTYNFYNAFGGLGGILHFLFTMSLLYWFGTMYERMHGSRNVWILYLGGGVIGGVSMLIWTFVRSVEMLPLFSAMPAVIAILGAVAYLYPREGISLFFMFNIPVRFVVGGLVIIELVEGWMGVACLTSALFGIGFAYTEKNGLALGDLLSRLRAKPNVRKVQQPIRQKEVSMRIGSPSTIRHVPIVKPPEKSSISVREQVTELTDIDQLLDKINEKGYDALTEAEKRRLYEASKN